jgi:type IV fimbrial biogenesis protein FimT
LAGGFVKAGNATSRSGTKVEPRTRGFSLIELMVVIAIAAVLFGIGVPNMQQYVVSSRLSSTSNEFFTTLNLARSEAVRRSAQVTLVTSGAANSRDWTTGWTMFVDTNRDGALSAGEEVLRVGPALENPTTMFGSANFGTSVSFDSTGRLTSGGGTFVICHGTALVVDGLARSRALILNSAGRARVAFDSNNDHIPETDTGAVPNCNNS